MENLIPLFIALTGAAVLLQAGMLVALYLSVRKSSVRMEALAVEVKTKALPASCAACPMTCAPIPPKTLRWRFAPCRLRRTSSGSRCI
jgi:hypothetical protein